MIAFVLFVVVGMAGLVALELVAAVALGISDWRRAEHRKRVERAYRLESIESEIGCVEGMLAEHEGGNLPLSFAAFPGRLRELRAEAETLRGAS